MDKYKITVTWLLEENNQTIAEESTREHLDRIGLVDIGQQGIRNGKNPMQPYLKMTK